MSAHTRAGVEGAVSTLSIICVEVHWKQTSRSGTLVCLSVLRNCVSSQNVGTVSLLDQWEPPEEALRSIRHSHFPAQTW